MRGRPSNLRRRLALTTEPPMVYTARCRTCLAIVGMILTSAHDTKQWQREIKSTVGEWVVAGFEVVRGPVSDEPIGNCPCRSNGEAA